jgi:uncharacterized protein (TIGR02145 family)
MIKNLYNLQKRKILFLGLLLLSFLLLISFQTIQAQTGCLNKQAGINRFEKCNVNNNQSLEINAQGCEPYSCQTITNRTGKTVSITTKNCDDWYSFLIHQVNNSTIKRSSCVVKNQQDTPSAPTLLSQTETSVTLKAITNGEYRREVDGNWGNWQTSNLFDGLLSGKEYKFQQRYRETTSYYVSLTSGTAVFSTKSVEVKKQEQALEENQSVKKEETSDSLIETKPIDSSSSNCSNFSYKDKEYSVVEIGDQCWMAENLNYATKNSWCYGNNPVNCEKYGRLYSWNDALSVCPSGWRLSSDDDWKNLETFLEVDSKKSETTDLRNRVSNDSSLRLRSSSDWRLNAGNNSSGFNALPGGSYIISSSSFSFTGLNNQAHFWTSTVHHQQNKWAFSRELNTGININRNSSSIENRAFSVRCIKN